MNVFITSQCSLEYRCGYCFARTSNKNHMPLSEISGWIEKFPNEPLKLLGGEPTLHPDFMSILSISSARNSGMTVVFSNGTETEIIRKAKKRFSDQVSFVVNFNTLKILQDRAVDFVETLKVLTERDSFSFTLDGTGKSYKNILEFCNKYGDISEVSKVRNIRISYSQGGREFYEKAIEEYNNVLQYFIDREYVILFDCNKTPSCLEYKLVKIPERLSDRSNADRNYTRCCTVGDIYSDGSFVRCMGCRELSVNVDKSKIHNLFEEYSLAIDSKIREADPKDDVCRKCEMYKLSLCNGGCAIGRDIISDEIKEINKILERRHSI